MTYNGFENYPTWRCYQLIDNDNWFKERMKYYKYTGELAEAIKDYVEIDDSTDIDIKVTIDEEPSHLGSRFYNDLLEQAIDSINYYEIAEMFIAKTTKSS